MLHVPVLLEESLSYLVSQKNGNYIDCTYGRGGHTKSILKLLSNDGFLTAFDKDRDAYLDSKKIDNSNFEFINSSFKDLEKFFKKNSIDGILFDLGTCSTHFDDEKRGFGFKKNGPLDMRFDNTHGFPVSKWLNNANSEEIKEILYKFGDEKHAKLITKSILDYRKKTKIKTTHELANIILDIYPEKKIKIHPATKTFQALRIFINNELEELKIALESAASVLKKNGIIVVISFHSLEDRIVKNFFKPKIKNYPKDLPINSQKEKKFNSIAKKIRPSSEEILKNKRSRSAIMRVFKKI